MNLKNKAEKIIPICFRPFARTLYRIINLPHYYIPYLFSRGKARYPLVATFELTYHCNLKCLMCPLSIEKSHQESEILKKQKMKKELKTEEIQKIIDDLSDMGVRRIVLTGGEPFLRTDIFKIIKNIKKNQLVCTILSNGTLINKSQAKRLVEYQVDNLVFSLDGNQQTHDIIRNVPNSFQKLISAISFINEAKQALGSNSPSLTLSNTISSINADHLNELMDIAYRFHTKIHYGYLYYTTQEMIKRTSQIIEMGDAKNEDQDMSEELKTIDFEKLDMEIKKIKEKEKKYGIEATFQPPLKGKEVRLRFSDDNFSYTSKCFYPWYAIRINPYGEVYPCSMALCMGNIQTTSIKDIWNNDKYVHFRRLLKKKGVFPKCTKCCILNTKLWTYLPKFSLM